MGLVVNESDIGGDTFDVARWLLRRVKGGLGIVATVAANAMFAAITGSSHCFCGRVLESRGAAYDQTRLYAEFLRSGRLRGVPCLACFSHLACC